MKMFAFNVMAMILLMKENIDLMKPFEDKGYNTNPHELQNLASMGMIKGSVKVILRSIHTSIKNGDDVRLQKAYNHFAEQAMGQEAMKAKIFAAISEKQDCADVSAESDELSTIIQEAVNKGFDGEVVNLDDMADHLEYNISMLIRAKNAIVYLNDSDTDEE